MRALLRRRSSGALLLASLAFAPSAAAQTGVTAGDTDIALREYLRLVDGALAIKVALGQTTAPQADALLDAAARGFVSRGSPQAELVAMRSELQIAAGGFFGDLDRSIAGATSFPGPLPLEISRALARRLLGTARSKFTQALANGSDPMPVLAQASKVLARVRGFTDLPRELDRFADAAQRAERIAASMPPPPAMGGPVAMGGPMGGAPGSMGPGGPPPPGGIPQAGPGGQPGMIPPTSQPYPGTPAAGPGPVAMGGPGGSPPASNLPRALPPPGSTGAGGGMPPATSRPTGQVTPPPGPTATGGPGGPGIPGATMGPGATAGPGGRPSGPGTTMPGAMMPGPTMPGPGPTTSAPGSMGPSRAPVTAPAVAVQESDPLLAVLGVGTMEAEARLGGFTWMDVVGRTWPPINDGEPDTEIQLKLLAPGLILDGIEIRSAPDPTQAIWTTRGAVDTGPIGLVQGTRLLNDAKGSVSGLQIEDFVVLKLYIQDDGLLERLEQPGTITITYKGGDVATVPIAPLW